IVEEGQALFLHIACFFFFNEDVDHLTNMLSHSNLDIGNGFKTLTDKSLVNISFYREIVMHSLLQKLGRQIVVEQSDEPGKRPFLVEPQEVRDALANETGTGSLIGIKSDMTSQQCHKEESRLHQLSPASSGSYLIYKEDSRVHHRSPATRVSHRRKLHKNRVNSGSSPSLKSLNANNCLSLKTVHCSFHSPLKELTFYNCVKLDEEARRGIIQQPVHEATGNSITISEATFSASSRFKAYFLVSPIEDYGFNSFFSEARVYELSPLSEHLFILHCERRNRRHDVATSEITFEFRCVYNDEKIIECGVHVLAEAAESSSNSEMVNFEFESSNSKLTTLKQGVVAAE
ncbi:hypothetical protein IGI04_015710, partial [Brassica rapa subsp. trilocularis]